MKISVLDHGYVELIECWGTGKAGVGAIERFSNNFDSIEKHPDFEVGIIEAARQSTQGSFRGWGPGKCSCNYADFEKAYPGSGVHAEDCPAKLNPKGDTALFKYLYDHKHSTPFEFAGMVIEVQAPIFVFREWQRHRTQSYNEMSARYAPLPNLYYEPDVEAVKERINDAIISKNKQQLAENKPGSDFEIKNWTKHGWLLNEQLEEHYQLGLKLGVPKELARIQMPVGHYSRMRAAANLRNWLQFMTLRCAPTAQWEIQQFAWAVSDLVHAKFPHTHELWTREYCNP